MAGLLVFESFSKRRTPTADGMSCRDVCRRALIFSWKVLKDRGKADTMSASAKPCVHGFWRTWMARVGGPVMMKTAVSLFIRKFTSEDLTSRHVYRMLREFVGCMAPLRYEPCTQFINVSQRALHIYFIDGCRVCPLDAQYKVKNKNSDLWANSQIAVSVLTLHGS